MNRKNLTEICNTDNDEPENNMPIIEGKLKSVADISYEYTDKRIFYRSTHELVAARLKIAVKKTEHIWIIPITKTTTYCITFPKTISHGLAKEILNENVRYTHEQQTFIDNMEGNYKKDTHTLVILSGSRKNEKYDVQIIH